MAKLMMTMRKDDVGPDHIRIWLMAPGGSVVGAACIFDKVSMERYWRDCLVVMDAIARSFWRKRRTAPGV